MRNTSVINMMVSMIHNLCTREQSRYCRYNENSRSFCCCGMNRVQCRHLTMPKSKVGFESSSDEIQTQVIKADISTRNIAKNIEIQKQQVLSNRGQTLSQHKDEVDTKNSHGTNYSGLLHYRKWWERVNVEISVNGTLVSGVPIFIEENTLRVINNSSSYFIPLEKVDFIRTSDGLDSCALSGIKQPQEIV